MTSEPDVAEMAASVMEQRGLAVARDGAWLRHRDSGIGIRPHLLQSQASGSFVRSVMVVMTSHPRLAPDGIFEYQHAVAGTLSEAIRSGFDQWLQIDFTVFLDALRDRPEHCMTLEWRFQRDGAPERIRRAVLGPVAHMVTHPERASGDGEHPFCPCCLLTNTYEAFQRFIEADAFYGIRFFAARNDDGSTQADCRVNGEDWQTGQRALCDYVDTWPQAGFEFRKQYVVLQTLTP